MHIFKPLPLESDTLVLQHAMVNWPMELVLEILPGNCVFFSDRKNERGVLEKKSGLKVYGEKLRTEGLRGK